MTTWLDFQSEAVAIVDFLLGGLLKLPRDATLVIFALITVVLLVAIRRMATNQDLLRRCAADLVRLKQLRREARQKRDSEAVTRISRTKNSIKLLQLKADLIVLAAAIVPLGLLAIWAVERLDFLPARPGQTLEITAYYPLSSVDRLTHLVPRPDMELESPSLQSVTVDEEDRQRGRARWTFRPSNAQPEFVLVIHHAGEKSIHPVRIGGDWYAPAILEHPGNERLTLTHVSLDRYKFLGIDPHLERIGLAPWLVAYIVLSVALTPFVRRLSRVA